MLSGFRFDKTKKVDIKKLDLNEFDKINLMNTIMKFDSKLYNDILDSYINPIFSDDEIINNNYSNIRQYDTLSNTGLNNVDVGSCKMYSGVRKMHQHLGFNNQSDAANPNKNSYWKNIINNRKGCLETIPHTRTKSYREVENLESPQPYEGIQD